jgi:hypothetical protein
VCTLCRENQSLVSFLSESGGGGAGGRAQLDRENAHFILSEAMIRTLEQIGFDNKYAQKISILIFYWLFFISINVDSRIFFYFKGWGGRADAVVKRLTRRCGNSGGGSAGPFRFAGAPKSSSGAAADTGEVTVAFFRKVLFRLCSRVESEQFGAGPVLGNPSRN